MNWSSASQIAERTAGTICLLALAGSAIFAAHKVGQATDAVRVGIAPIAPAVASLNATLEFIDRPCASVDPKTGKLLPDGTICQLNEAIHDMRKIATASGKQVQQTSDVITAMSGNLDKAGDAITEVSDSLSGTAKAATGTLGAIQSDAETLKPLLPVATDTVAKLGTAADSLNDILKNKAITRTFDGLATTADNAGKITTDLYVYAHPILNPTPCKTAGCRFKRDMETLSWWLGVGGNAERVYSGFAGQPVKIKH